MFIENYNGYTIMLDRINYVYYVFIDGIKYTSVSINILRNKINKRINNK